MNEIVNKHIYSAKRITSIISILTFTTIYLLIFTHISQISELEVKKERKDTLVELLTKSDSVLFEIRTFYEGSVEGSNNYTFALYIYALTKSDFKLNLILDRVDFTSLTKEDIYFLNNESYSLKNNIHDLRTIVSDLIEQKRKRILFDELTFSDLSDLYHHKWKDSWLYNLSANSLKMALTSPESPYFQPSTLHVTGLENRYNYYLDESEKRRSNKTKPPTPDTTKKVTDLLEELKLKGYKTLYQLKSEIRSIEEEIEELENEFKVSLSLPITNISIKYSSMIWLIPITLIILLILLNFYLGKINLAFKSIFQKNESIELFSVPWFFIKDDNLSKRISIPAKYLKMTILVSVIIAEIIPLIITNLNLFEWFFSIVFIVVSTFLLFSIFKQLSEINKKKAYNNVYKK